MCRINGMAENGGTVVTIHVQQNQQQHTHTHAGIWNT